MPDIILIQPPVEDYYFTFKRSIPYGLACIAASLEEHGFSVEIIDSLAVNKSKIIEPPKEFSYLKKYYGKKDISPFSLFHSFRHYGYSFEHIGKLVKDKNPFLVGIASLFTSYSNEALHTAKIVKKFLPQCKTVLGGHHPSVLPKEVMKSKYVDFLLRGEGEVSMPVLANTLKNGTKPENVPGIVFRKKNGSLHISKPAWIRDLNNLPLPDMTLVNHKFYQRKKRGCTIVVTSRGCPMKCTYCSMGASSSYAEYRTRRVESVINELKAQIDKYNIGFVDFEDENLTLNKKWFLSFAKEMEKLFRNREVELRAMNGLFPRSLDDEIVCAMKKAGFKTLNLSLGSISKKQIKAFNRPDVKKSFENALLLAEKYSMETVSYIIAGAPGQKAKDSVNDLLYLAGKKTLAGLSIFYPAPGSQDYNTCLKENLLPDYYTMMRSTALPISHSTTRIESLTLLRLSRIVNFIKKIIKKNGRLPEPVQFNSPCTTDKKGRETATEKLLPWFLYDGIIRGITPDGHIFEHCTDKKLTGLFIQGLEKIIVKGVK